MLFRFKAGWPQCDLTNFERLGGDQRPRWFSGAIPDDNYRSKGVREIAGMGNLYFGFDAGARDWKIVHTDQPLGLVNEIEAQPPSDSTRRGAFYRDFYEAKTVKVIGSK